MRNKTLVSQEGKLENLTFQPIAQRTFRPHGSGQVPARVPSLPSGVAPLAQPQSRPAVVPQPASTGASKAGNDASQGGN